PPPDRWLVVWAGLTHGFAVRERFHKAEGVLALGAIELVRQHGICGAFLARQFEFGIADDHFAIVRNTKFAADLKDDPGFIILCRHGSLPRPLSWPFRRCRAFDAPPRSNDATENQ